MPDTRFYTIKELALQVKRTPATIYTLMKRDEETRRFFQEHRIEKSKGGYIYDEEALKRLKNQYLMENGVGGEEIDAENKEVPQASSPDSEEIERLKAELEQLRAKYEALEADFRKVDGERVELLRQNGLKTEETSHLLLLLSQEKAEKLKIEEEKQKLLPPPHRTFGERIASLFHRK